MSNLGNYFLKGLATDCTEQRFDVWISSRPAKWARWFASERLDDWAKVPHLWVLFEIKNVLGVDLLFWWVWCDVVMKLRESLVQKDYNFRHAFRAVINSFTFTPLISSSYRHLPHFHVNQSATTVKFKSTLPCCHLASTRTRSVRLLNPPLTFGLATNIWFLTSVPDSIVVMLSKSLVLVLWAMDSSTSVKFILRYADDR